MRLTIVLPHWASHPIGGYRVHYEYANRLAARGHSVRVVTPVQSRLRRFRLRLLGLQRRIRGMVTWFNFDPRVRLGIFDGRSIPRCDVAIVTAWLTAEMASSGRRRPRSVVQIAYDYEFWMVADDERRARMANAFAQPDTVIATSQAVAEMLRAAGREPDETIPCGLDLDVFHVERDLSSRGPVIGFIARSGHIKRCEDAVAALDRIRMTHDIRVVAIKSSGAALPSWVETLDAPTDADMCAFYNELAIYLLPSAYEGWGLTAAEAMACGAAVITTRNGGVEDFAFEGVNALLVPPREPDALAEACEHLLKDEVMRRRIAESGVTTAQAMDWECSVDALEAVLIASADGNSDRKNHTPEL
jgi:glycosyltransferase involved in cell wall biosynthesis